MILIHGTPVRKTDAAELATGLRAIMPPARALAERIDRAIMTGGTVTIDPGDARSFVRAMFAADSDPRRLEPLVVDLRRVLGVEQD